jgi:hypothetical protein
MENHISIEGVSANEEKGVMGLANIANRDGGDSDIL